MLSVLITKTKEMKIRKVWEVLGIHNTLIGVMVSQVFAYVQIHQIVHIKYVQFLYTHYTSIKLLKCQIST